MKKYKAKFICNNCFEIGDGEFEKGLTVVANGKKCPNCECKCLVGIHLNEVGNKRLKNIINQSEKNNY